MNVFAQLQRSLQLSHSWLGLSFMRSDCDGQYRSEPPAPALCVEEGWKE